jgi:hypothetical protein
MPLSPSASDAAAILMYETANLHARKSAVDRSIRHVGVDGT